MLQSDLYFDFNIKFEHSYFTVVSEAIQINEAIKKAINGKKKNNKFREELKCFSQKFTSVNVSNTCNQTK